jgi:pimeloyl-ACP methyl ester carboxylesterase
VAAPIVGWSSGAALALACAHALPGRVTALAVVAGQAPVDGLPPGAVDQEVREQIPTRSRDPVAAWAATIERLQWLADRPAAMLDAIDEGDAMRSDEPDARLHRLPAVTAILASMFSHGMYRSVEGAVDDLLATALPWSFSTSEVACPTTVCIGVSEPHGSSRKLT